MDSDDDSYRKGLYPEYKAQRDKRPEDLNTQIPRIEEIAKAFNIPVYRSPGYEADDVIASIISQIEEKPELDYLQIKILSKDKDLEQLISSRVSLLDNYKDEEITEEKLWEKRGITPKQAIDYQSLMGDASDNIPGVRGIGPKTAANLIQYFGSVDDLLNNLDQVTGKKQEKIASDKDNIKVSRDLVTLRKDLGFTFDLEGAKVTSFDLDKIRDIFNQLSFNTLSYSFESVLKKQPALT